MIFGINRNGRVIISRIMWKITRTKVIRSCRGPNSRCRIGNIVVSRRSPMRKTETIGFHISGTPSGSESDNACVIPESYYSSVRYRFFRKLNFLVWPKLTYHQVLIGCLQVLAVSKDKLFSLLNELKDTEHDQKIVYKFKCNNSFCVERSGDEGVFQDLYGGESKR